MHSHPTFVFRLSKTKYFRGIEYRAPTNSFEQMNILIISPTIKDSAMFVNISECLRIAYDLHSFFGEVKLQGTLCKSSRKAYISASYADTYCLFLPACELWEKNLESVQRQKLLIENHITVASVVQRVATAWRSPAGGTHHHGLQFRIHCFKLRRTGLRRQEYKTFYAPALARVYEVLRYQVERYQV